jgi:uncharacterized protein (TIGR02147 family)
MARTAGVDKKRLVKMLKSLGTDRAVGDKLKVTRQAIFLLRKKYGIESSRPYERKKKHSLTTIDARYLGRRRFAVHQLNMKPILSYINYREFLSDYFVELRKKDARFSHRFLAARLGISMPNLFLMVMQGKRKLSSNLSSRLQSLMVLRGREKQYFKYMIAYSHAKNFQEKSLFLVKILMIRQNLHSRNTEKLYYDFLSNWYNAALRQLLGHPEFKGNYDWLANKLSPAISANQARDSIRLMRKLGLTTVEGKSLLRKKALVGITPEIEAIAESVFQRSMALLAASSYDRNSKNEHNLTSCTVNLTKQHYEEVIEDVSVLRKIVLSRADKPDKKSRVYQLNFHLFPLSTVSKTVRGSLTQ